MKTSLYLLSIVALLSFVSCEKYGENISTPKVSVTVSPENPKVGDEVTITITTDGQYLSLYTGDDGHQFERSRIKAIMEHDWESFSQECYRVPYAKNGEKTLFYCYFKDYKSIEEVKRDFEFFGAIDNIQLVPYNKGDFPEALMEMSYIGTNQLKFTITDRRIPSGIKFKPNIHFFGGAANQSGNTIIESRFVACAEDRALRKYTNEPWIPVRWGIYTEQLADHEGYPAGYQHYCLRSEGRFAAFQTNDPLSRRPTEGFYKFSIIYEEDYLRKFFEKDGEKLVLRQVDLYMNGELTEGADSSSPWAYDFDGKGVKYYQCELNPATGLPVRENDYPRYRGFQGDVYMSFIEAGTDKYEPWHDGVSLGSVYTTGGIRSTYTYTYTEAGAFTISAVATNVGNKNYKGKNYNDKVENSPDDYSQMRAVGEIKITVRP